MTWLEASPHSFLETLCHTWKIYGICFFVFVFLWYIQKDFLSINIVVRKRHFRNIRKWWCLTLEACQYPLNSELTRSATIIRSWILTSLVKECGKLWDPEMRFMHPLPFSASHLCNSEKSPHANPDEKWTKFSVEFGVLWI